MGMGIYAIYNKFNNKMYIGSAKNLKTRFKTHFNKLNSGVHPNLHLQAAYNKYGKNSFEIRLLQFIYKLEDLIKSEQYWIDLSKHEEGILYNKRIIAESNLGWKQSQKTIEKRKQTNINKGFTYGKGVSKSISAIEKMRQSKLGQPHPRKGDYYTIHCKKGHTKTIYSNGNLRCKECRKNQMKFYNSLNLYIQRGG